jgi:hypothetical protein
VKNPSPKTCAISVDGESAVTEAQLVEALRAAIGEKTDVSEARSPRVTEAPR